MSARLVIVLALTALFAPLCLWWHEFLHTLIARANDWAFRVTFTPLGPLQGSRTFALSEVQFPLNPTRLELFLFAAAPRIFDVVALPALWALLRLPWSPWVELPALALLLCWGIDLGFETALAFLPERDEIDAWGTFQALDAWVSLGVYRLLSAGLVAAVASLVGSVLWEHLR